MAPIAWTDVVAVSSPLASVVVAQQDAILAMVNAKLSFVFDGEDGPTTKLARIYVAAHFASSPGAGEQRPGGAVTSESRGGLSRSYAPPPSGAASYEGTWSDTQWGRRYLQLLLGSKARWPRTPGQGTGLF